MAHGLWVARLRVSQKTAEKLDSKADHISWREVVDAVECREGLVASLHLDAGGVDRPPRGWRWIVKIRLDARPALVVLYDAHDPLGDVYNLGSAYYED